MSETISARIGQFIRGISARQIRIICGVILFAYLISHFVNHALGNISLEAMAWACATICYSGNSLP